MRRGRDPQPKSPRGRAIGPIGTLARVAVGLAFLAFAASRRPTWDEIALGLIAFPAILIGVQLVWRRSTSRPLRLTGRTGFWINTIVLAGPLVLEPTQSAALIWLGTSMLLAAQRGYAGCESLAISNWLLRRDDQIGCLLFSPIDQAEARSTHVL